MENRNIEIYLQPKEKIYIKPDATITVGDMCEISGEKATIEAIKKIKVTQGPYGKTIFVIILLSIIKHIKEEFPNVSIYILSERDILIETVPTKKNQNKILEVCKVALVCALSFIGAGVAIMNFHADVNMAGAQQNFYEILTGNRIESPLWISIPYSIGIGVGMIAFFNHISPKNRKTNHPSPLDLELYSYQNNLDDFIRQKAKERRE